jgi:hypothetical protein
MITITRIVLSPLSSRPVGPELVRHRLLMGRRTTPGRIDIVSIFFLPRQPQRKKA